MRLFLPSLLVLAGASLATQEPPPEPEGADEPAQQEAPAPVHVTPAEVERRLTSLYEGTLLGVQDGQDFAETPGYRRLVEIVGGYGENELRDKRPPLLDRAKAVADPAAFRGELLHVRGLLAGLEAQRLSHPIGESIDVYRAVVTEPNGDEAVVVDFLHPPSFTPDLGDDMVETEAVFVRMVGYVSKKDIPRQAPYLIARDLRKWDTEQLSRRTAFDSFAMILIGAALAYFVFRVVMSTRSRKGRRDDPDSAARQIRERARLPLQSRPPAGKP